MGHPAVDGNFCSLPVELNLFLVQLPVLTCHFRFINRNFSGIGLFESDTALHNSHRMLLVLYQFHISICYRLWNWAKCLF